MGFLELTNVKKQFGAFAAVEDFVLSAAQGRVRLLPRALRLRQDDHAAHDRRLRIPRLGQHQGGRQGDHQPAAQQAQRGHGLPGLCALPEHDRGRQRRLRHAHQEAAQGRHRASASASCSSSSTCPRRPTATRTSSRAASSSASRWPARWPSSRRSSCSTSRSRRSTPRSASPCAPRSAPSSASSGITTVYVTHDQEEALSLSDRVVVMSQGRIEQIGTPFEIYNFPATAFVASFVGTLNALQADVVDAAGRHRLGRRTAGSPGSPAWRGRSQEDDRDRAAAGDPDAARRRRRCQSPERRRSIV